MIVRAVSRRRMGPWMRGPQGVVHPDTHELCVIESGVVGVSLGGQEGRVHAGQISWIPAGAEHGSWTESEPVEELIVHLDAASVDARLGTLPAGSRTLRTEEDRALGALRYAATHARPELAEEAALQLASGFALGSDAPTADPRLSRVMEAVRADLTCAWTVTALAGIAAMSPSQFSRAFKEAVGGPPVRWVLDQRVERAEWLMRTTPLPLSEIAHAVGFRTSSRLTEAFSRRHGEPPSVWRARHR